MALRLGFTDQDYFRDPAAGLERLRKIGPVVEVRFPIVGKVWLTTNYALAGRVLKDSERSPCARMAAASPDFAGGCPASFARSPATCSPWTSRTTRGCGASSMRLFAGAQFSRWSRASWRLPIGAFGTGIHFCLGFQLARLEGKCALKGLFTRWPKLALAVPADEIRWLPRPGLKAIEKLPVTAGA